MSKRKQRHTIAQGYSYLTATISGKLEGGHPNWGAKGRYAVG